jgi:MFS family permease
MRGRGLWGHRDFRFLWGGQSISELGSQVSLLAIPLLAVRTLHASTFEVGVLTAASTAAFLIVGLPAGVWVDRLRRRPVMIAADLGRMVALGSIPVAYAFGDLRLVQLYVVTLLAGVLTVFFDVAYQSYLPSLVGREHLVEGNAKLTGSAQVAQVAGPSVAGGLVQAIGGSYAVAADAVSFLVSATAVGGIRTPEAKARVPEGGHRRLHRDMGEGLRFVFGNALLRAIMLTTASSNLFSGLMNAVEIVFLVRVVHAPPGIIGLLFAGASIGGVLAALVATPLARRIGGARATFLGIFLNAGGLLIPLTGRGIGLLLFAGGVFFYSFGAILYNINQVSFRQRLCPDHLLGRMNATMRFVVWGVLPIGALIGGVIGTSIGLRPTLWIAAIGESLAGVWLVASPMRHMRDYPAGEDSGDGDDGDRD